MKKRLVLVAAISTIIFGLSTLSVFAQRGASSVGTKGRPAKSEKLEIKNRELSRKYRASLTPAKIKAAQESSVIVSHPVHQDVSGPLEELIQNKQSFPTEAPRPMRDGRRELLEVDDPQQVSAGPLVESFLQTDTPLPSAAIAGTSFEGPGGGIPGYVITSIPPDTTMAVGPNHIVAWVNVHLMIFNKAGVPQLPGNGFVSGNTLWAGFGGGCETTNRGDPLVQYDRLADRWIFSQFAFAVNGSGNPITPYLQCFAISTGPNPAGPYHRYSYSFDTAGPTSGPAFNDYGKIGIWNDAYYVAYNMFGGSPAGGNVGAALCAYNKALMLSGGAATSICAPTTFYGGGAAFLPADLDGNSPPTDTTRGGLFLRQSTAPALRFLRLKPDFATPSNTTLSDGFGGAAGSFVNLPSAQTRACNGGGGTCIPQPGTANQLDTLGDRLMYRLSYRNRGGVDSLVVSMAADPDGAGGQQSAMRWWEIRNPLGNPNVPATAPFIFQSGTYSPDATNRWMGSAAMNGDGDIMMAYSVSSSTVSPGLRIAGRQAADAAGTLQAEQVAQAGGGSQTGFTRWGDYTTIQVDPSDDRTFWFIGQYYSATSAFTWRTRIFSYTFPLPNAPPSITAAAGLTRTQGSAATVSQIATVSDPDNAANTLSVTVNGGSNATVNGVTVSAISVNAAGQVSASIAAACAATNASFTLRVTDPGGLFAEATLSITVINETTPPVINPISNVVAFLPPNSSATSMPVSFPLPTATDNCGTPTVTTNPVSGSVFNVGTTTVNVTATDGNGNTSTATFTVQVRYNFSGFSGRVSNPPATNSVTAGNRIPVSFSLSGDKGLNIFAAGSPSSQQVNCLTGTPIGAGSPTTASPGLNYFGGQYTYYWQTNASWAGTCRVFLMTLKDDTSRTANFSFFN